VFLAVDLHSHNTFAIKVLSKRHIVKEDKIKYVNIEKTTLHRLGQQHPGIVQLYFTFQDEQSLFFVLDFAEYGELLLIIRRFGSLSEPLSKFYMLQLVDSVKFIHSKGVIHRDLKPENILVGHDFNLKITDFGAAKLIDDHVETDDTIYDTVDSIDKDENPQKARKSERRGSFVGTAEYVSPELLKYNTCGFESDVWAIGCILYQFFTGSPPFKGGTEYLTFEKIINVDFAYHTALPQEVCNIIDSILVFDASKRMTIPEIMKSAWFNDCNWDDKSFIWSRKVPRFEPYVPGKSARVGKSNSYQQLHSQIKNSDFLVPSLLNKSYQPPTKLKKSPYMQPGPNVSSMPSQYYPSRHQNPRPPHPNSPTKQMNPGQQINPNQLRQQPVQPTGPISQPKQTVPCSKPPQVQVPKHPPHQQPQYAPKTQSSGQPSSKPNSDYTSDSNGKSTQGRNNLRHNTAFDRKEFTQPNQYKPASGNFLKINPGATSSTASNTSAALQAVTGAHAALTSQNNVPKPITSTSAGTKPTAPVQTGSPKIPQQRGAEVGSISRTQKDASGKNSSPAMKPTPTFSLTPPTKQPTSIIKFKEISSLLDTDEKILKMDVILKLHLPNSSLNRPVNQELDDTLIERLISNYQNQIKSTQIPVITVITTKARVFFVDGNLNVMMVDLKANEGGDYSMYDYEFEDEESTIFGYLILELIREGGDLVFLKRIGDIDGLSLQSLVSVVGKAGNEITLGKNYSWIECLLLAKEMISNPKPNARHPSSGNNTDSVIDPSAQINKSKDKQSQPKVAPKNKIITTLNSGGGSSSSRSSLSSPKPGKSPFNLVAAAAAAAASQK
jgi:protein-serine/threonine kinase